MFKVFTGGKFGTAVAVAALAMTFGTTANAATSYGDIATPFGVYFGSGNVNGNFTIGNSNGIELALRAKTFGGATIDGSSGVYQANTGFSPNRTPTQTPRLDWNYEFSINTIGSQSALSNFVFRLGVDNDPTAGVNFTFVNPVTYFGDNPTRTIPGTDLIAGTQVVDGPIQRRGDAPVQRGGAQLERILDDVGCEFTARGTRDAQGLGVAEPAFKRRERAIEAR